MLLESVAKSPGKGSEHLCGAWNEACWEGKANPWEHFSHGLKMRDLNSQREGGIPCGRNGMN